MENKEFIYPNNEPLMAADSAKHLYSSITEGLRELVKCGAVSPLDAEFRRGFDRVLSIYDEFQKETLSANKRHASCRKGCAVCCYHWAEDVNSFEMQIISDYIKTHMPQCQQEEIKDACRGDIAAMENLEKIVEEKLSALNSPEKIDTSLLLLSSFYQLERPCPLLTSGGECSVYNVRPITCRIYMSLSEPKYCDPLNINDGDVATCVLDLSEEANALLDILHLRFRPKNIESSALRVALYEMLSGNCYVN